MLTAIDGSTPMALEMTSEFFSDNFKGRVLRACLDVLTPLVKCLVRCDVRYEEFSNLAKIAYVQAVSKPESHKGRERADAKIASLTGLAKKEVRDVKTLMTSETDNGVARSLGADVLHVWHTSKRFVDKDSRPLPLPFRSTEGPDFSELVSIAAADACPETVRFELNRIGAIVEDYTQRIRPLRRHFVPTASEEKLLISFRQNLKALVKTIEFNTSKTDEQPGRIERFVYTETLPDQVIDRIRPIIRRRVESFTEAIDDELTVLSSNSTDAPNDCDVSVGVGVFYFEEPEKKIR